MKMTRTTAFSTMALVAAFGASTAQAQFNITVLHNNDGESGLFAGDDGVGGVAEFKTHFDATKTFYENEGHGVVSVYAGDTFLAGPEFQASLDSGTPGSRTFYDARAISRIGYDASIIGNHEFDFGPDVLAEFINDAQTTNTTTYLSANLDFSGEASLNALVASDLIAPSKLVTVNAGGVPKKVGIIGATTQNLPFISSPGAVSVSNVAVAVDAQVTSLQGQGADVIILGSHLQGLSEDQNLVSALSANSQSAINLIIAGGGDELQASNVNDPTASPKTVYGGSAPKSVADTNVRQTGTTDHDDDPLTPEIPVFENVEGPYPDFANVAGIPIVTTRDQYSYLGRVTLKFDAGGNFTGVDTTSNPQLNTGFAPDSAVESDIAPVQTFLDNLAKTVVGTSTVQLLQGGSNTIRAQETNLGSLVADAQRNAALDLAGDFGISLDPDLTVGIANGGGIRDGVAAGGMTLLDTFNVSPFGNFVSVIEDMSVADFVLTLENAVSRVVDGEKGPGITPQRQGDGTGRFAQVAGFSFVYDIKNQALDLDEDGNELAAGERIVELTLDDGTKLVEDGEIVVDNAGLLLDLVLPSFNAAGGDQYNDGDYLSKTYAFTRLTITDQQALADYIESFNGEDLANVLGGEYANVDGAGRIGVVPEPTSLALLAIGGLMVARRRRSA